MGYCAMIFICYKSFSSWRMAIKIPRGEYLLRGKLNELMHLQKLTFKYGSNMYPSFQLWSDDDEGEAGCQLYIAQREVLDVSKL